MSTHEHIPCEEARDRFSAFLDGELGPNERDEFEAHLMQCSECLRELDGLQRVGALYRELSFQAAPEGFETRVRNAVRPRFAWGRALKADRRAYWPLALAAAVLALVLGPFVYFSSNMQPAQQMAEAPDATAPAYELREPAFEEQSAGGDTREQLQALGYLGDDSQDDAAADVAEEQPADQDARQQFEALGYLDGNSENVAAEEQAQAASPREESRAVGGMEISSSGESASDAAIEAQPAEATPQGPAAAFAPRERTPSDAVGLELRDTLEGIDVAANEFAVSEESGAGSSAAKKTPIQTGSDIRPLQTPSAPALEPVSVERLSNADAQAFREKADNDDAATTVPLTKSETAQLRQPSRDDDAARGGLRQNAATSARLGRELSLTDQKAQSATVQDRVFELRDGVWTEAGYDGEETRAVLTGSRRWKRLLADHPELARVAALGETVIFRAEDAWWRAATPE